MLHLVRRDGKGDQNTSFFLFLLNSLLVLNTYDKVWTCNVFSMKLLFFLPFVCVMRSIQYQICYLSAFLFIGANYTLKKCHPQNKTPTSWFIPESFGVLKQWLLGIIFQISDATYATYKGSHYSIHFCSVCIIYISSFWSTVVLFTRYKNRKTLIEDRRKEKRYVAGGGCSPP